MSSPRTDPLSLVLRVLVAAGLVVDAIVHLRLASGYQLGQPGGIGQGNLFRIEAVVALLVALYVLVRGSRGAECSGRRGALPLRQRSDARADPDHVRADLVLPEVAQRRGGGVRRHHRAWRRCSRACQDAGLLTARRITVWTTHDQPPEALIRRRRRAPPTAPPSRTCPAHHGCTSAGSVPSPACVLPTPRSRHPRRRAAGSRHRG